MSTNRLPDGCDVAFKEWEGVCSALESGRQSIILRKGGIAEGPGGFAPEHAVFWLYPTRVHQAEQGLKPADALARPVGPTSEGTVGISTLAAVEVVGWVDDPSLLDALDPLHAWTAETVRKRFDYRQPGLWVLGVRVYRRAEPWAVPVTPEHAGCKTWVPLGESYSTAGLTPALDADAFDRRMGLLRGVLAEAPPSA